MLAHLLLLLLLLLLHYFLERQSVVRSISGARERLRMRAIGSMLSCRMAASTERYLHAHWFW